MRRADILSSLKMICWVRNYDSKKHNIAPVFTGLFKTEQTMIVFPEKKSALRMTQQNF